MKKTVIILFLFFISAGVIIAQNPYSLENLEKLSEQELDVYYNKALKLQKSGKTATRVGLISLGASFLTIPLDDSGGMVAATTIMVVGIPALVTTIVGVSMNSTGKKRVERINLIKNSALNDINIYLGPCLQYNLAAKNYQSGITLKIKF
ncbi:hypothetical protein E9993_22090 [Labilibacter sediminis]|nr:hypothetical protein E9993_22090 [Labilibacter sediminis]